MVLGVYYLTMERPGEQGENRIFANAEEVELAYSLGQAGLHAKIKMAWDASRSGKGTKKKLVETTVGRVLFNQILPTELQLVNDTLDKKTQRACGNGLCQAGPKERQISWTESKVGLVCRAAA
jgi:DNA-directed RNA polymerase subunit beta'